MLVVDRDSRRVLDNVIEEDAILNENITSTQIDCSQRYDVRHNPDLLLDIEQITDRRPPNRDVEALYFLTPQPHIVDCIMADFQKRKYKRAHLVWTSC